MALELSNHLNYLDPYLTPHININLTCILDLEVKVRIIKCFRRELRRIFS